MLRNDFFHLELQEVSHGIGRKGNYIGFGDIFQFFHVLFGDSLCPITC